MVYGNVTCVMPVMWIEIFLIMLWVQFCGSLMTFSKYFFTKIFCDIVMGSNIQASAQFQQTDFSHFVLTSSIWLSIRRHIRRACCHQVPSLPWANEGEGLARVTV